MIYQDAKTHYVSSCNKRIHDQVWRQLGLSSLPIVFHHKDGCRNARHPKAGICYKLMANTWRHQSGKLRWRPQEESPTTVWSETELSRRLAKRKWVPKQAIQWVLINRCKKVVSTKFGEPCLKWSRGLEGSQRASQHDVVEMTEVH